MNAPFWPLQLFEPSTYICISLCGIKDPPTMKPSTHLNNLIEYTTLTARTAEEIAASSYVPFLGATATLVLSILKCLDVSLFINTCREYS
jgi:hypothetical protein